MSICVTAAVISAGSVLAVDGSLSPAVTVFVLDSDQSSPCVHYQLLAGAEQALVENVVAQGVVNWDTVYQSFGYGLGLFMIGAGLGLCLNVARKLK